MRARLRLLIGLLASLVLSACGAGVNAGEEGGIAFIAFTIMLIVTIALMYYFLGRED
jgi:hypothetical protein